MPTKKTTKKATQTPGTADAGPALYDLAKEVGGIAEGLRPLHYVENMADHVADLASALRYLAHSNAMSAIAKFGTEQDREIALKHLKGWFDEFRD